MLSKYAYTHKDTHKTEHAYIILILDSEQDEGYFDLKSFH